MGRRLDGIALGAACVTGLYLFFLNAWRSIPLAALLTMACGALMRLLRLGKPARRRCTPGQARAELKRIAELDDAAAEQALGEVIRSRYGTEEYRVVPALKHPEARLSVGDVFSAWKAHRGEARIVVAATCPCEPRAKLCAREYRHPVVSRTISKSIMRRSISTTLISSRPAP